MTSRRSIPAPAVALAILLSANATASGQSSPPADLHQEPDGHWTPWSPPESHYQAPDAYVVQPGDTFWDLALETQGDGHLWPLLWERNQYVLDAHWIYPGDPLLLGPAPDTMLGDVAAPPLAEAPLEPEPPAPAPPVVAGDVDPPVPLGGESDIYCSGYIGDPDEEFPYTIVGSEFEFLTPTLLPTGTSEIRGLYGKADTEKYGLNLADIVYVSGGGAAGLSAGELLTVVSAEEEVDHPIEGRALGRFYRYNGRLRVLSVQEESAIAEIVSVCDPITVGSLLKIFEPEPVPLRRITPMRPPNYPPPHSALEGSASIVRAEDQVVALGAGQLVYIDRGWDDNVAPGDIYTVYRRGRRGLPPVVMGEVGILSVGSTSALARILRSRYTIYVGDALLPK